MNDGNFLSASGVCVCVCSTPWVVLPSATKRLGSHHFPPPQWILPSSAIMCPVLGQIFNLILLFPPPALNWHWGGLRLWLSWTLKDSDAEISSSHWRNRCSDYCSDRDTAQKLCKGPAGCHTSQTSVTSHFFCTLEATLDQQCPMTEHAVLC